MNLHVLLLGALAVAEGDEDIKIAQDHFSKAKPAVDQSELAAQDFLRQKKSGNIERARELGKLYASALRDDVAGPLAGELPHKALQVRHHLYLLYTYAVNRVIAEYSPDSILAQTSLNVYYSEIEEHAPELHKHVSDTAAFSLYILCERSRNRTDDELGRIFADLCGMRDDAAMIGYGNRIFHELYDTLSEMIKSVPYAPVDGE